MGDTVETNKTLSSIWFSWFVVTVLYVSLSLLRGNNIFVGYVTGFVGLFAPFGILSAVFLLSNPFSLLLFIVVMIIGDTALNEMNISFAKRILINLLFLLILTVLIDFVRGTPLASWQLFIRHMDWNFGIIG